MLLYQLSRPLAYLWIKEKSGSKSVISNSLDLTLSYKEFNIISSVLCRFQNNKIFRSTTYPEEKDNMLNVIKKIIEKRCTGAGIIV